MLQSRAGKTQNFLHTVILPNYVFFEVVSVLHYSCIAERSFSDGLEPIVNAQKLLAAKIQFNISIRKEVRGRIIPNLIHPIIKWKNGKNSIWIIQSRAASGNPLPPLSEERF